MKKKGKSLKTTRSDEDLNGSQEEDDDHVSNYMRFQVTSEKYASSTVANNVATTTAISSKFDDITTCSGSVSEFSEDSKSYDSDGDEPSREDIQNVY